MWEQGICIHKEEASQARSKDIRFRFFRLSHSSFVALSRSGITIVLSHIFCSFLFQYNTPLEKFHCLKKAVTIVTDRKMKTPEGQFTYLYLLNWKLHNHILISFWHKRSRKTWESSKRESWLLHSLVLSLSPIRISSTNTYVRYLVCSRKIQKIINDNGQ